MTRASRSMVVAALVALLVPAPSLAHAGGQPIIHVAAERVIQGETFTVVAADLGPDALVTLEISSRGRSYAVGQVVAQPDGHFTETFVMPADAPDGYAELWARGDDGSHAMMWLLVGDGPDGQAPEASSEPTGTGGLSWQFIGLAILWAVGLAAIAFVFLRSRPHRVRERRRRS